MTEGFAVDDFNRPEVTLAARLGSTAALAARQRFPKATLRLFDDEPAAVQEVKNGRVHAMVAGQPLPAQSAAAAPDLLKTYPDQLMKEPISMGIRKGDVDTLNFLNNWIETVRGKGWIDERYAYWFGSAQWQALVQ
jgi:polar amino acid transport system substrate-binding protein